MILLKKNTLEVWASDNEFADICCELLMSGKKKATQMKRLKELQKPEVFKIVCMPF